jgi:23S rRNA (uracil1939-C5)-methyltransferase
MTRHADELGSADFVLLDPPRAGAEPEAVRGIIALRPRHVSYVSCDPATLARDLRVLLDAGYTLDSLRAFDMFPQTHHVETVVHLRK